MYDYLEATQSSYFLAFKMLFSEVENTLSEAQEIADHLTPLIAQFETLETIEFIDIQHLLNPLFHTICLIWSHCKHYCKPNRIVVLIQEINNLIIKRTTLFLQPDELFQMDHGEVSNKLDTCLIVLNEYYTCFNAHAYSRFSFADK